MSNVPPIQVLTPLSPSAASGNASAAEPADAGFLEELQGALGQRGAPEPEAKDSPQDPSASLEASDTEAVTNLQNLPTAPWLMVAGPANSALPVPVLPPSETESSQGIGAVAEGASLGMTHLPNDLTADGAPLASGVMQAPPPTNPLATVATDANAAQPVSALAGAVQTSALTLVNTERVAQTVTAQPGSQSSDLRGDVPIVDSSGAGAQPAPSPMQATRPTLGDGRLAPGNEASVALANAETVSVSSAASTLETAAATDLTPTRPIVPAPSGDMTDAARALTPLGTQASSAVPLDQTRTAEGVSPSEAESNAQATMIRAQEALMAAPDSGPAHAVAHVNPSVTDLAAGDTAGSARTAVGAESAVLMRSQASPADEAWVASSSALPQETRFARATASDDVTTVGVTAPAVEGNPSTVSMETDVTVPQKLVLPSSRSDSAVIGDSGSEIAPVPTTAGPVVPSASAPINASASSEGGRSTPSVKAGDEIWTSSAVTSLAGRQSTKATAESIAAVQTVLTQAVQEATADPDARSALDAQADSGSSFASSFVQSLTGHPPAGHAVAHSKPLEVIASPPPLAPHQARLDEGRVQLEVVRLAQQGGGQVVMQLTPPDESKFRIDLTIGHQGMASLVVEGASDSTRARLEQTVQGLQEQFQQMGLQLQLDMRQSQQNFQAPVDTAATVSGAQPNGRLATALADEPVASARARPSWDQGQVYLVA